MTERTTDGRRHLRRGRGFTLLEVLGAVAILGLSYIMLATASIQGMQAIGQSQRRIEASLLADQTLVDLELAAELGQALEPPDETWESGPFEIEVEVLDASEVYTDQVTIEAAGNLLEYLGAEAHGPFAEFRERNLLLGYLREVHIAVRWRDAADELEITRTAFIYDQQAWTEHEQPQEQAASAESEDDTDDTVSEGER